MAIKILWGPGGSGKSYYQVRLVVEELLTTERNVVTNLALDPGALGDWLERNHPEASVRLNERLRFLTPHECRWFWKYRGPIRWTGVEYNAEEDKGERGVAYFIDESGAVGFGAKHWNAEAGRSPRGIECGEYLDQQRKKGDNVYFSTNGRTPCMIAKDIRDRGHEFIRLRNGYLLRYGPFRARGRFTATYFGTEPGHNTEPIRKEHWPMDTTGLASCYRTEEGVGVVGSSADKGARAKGIPILWAIPMWVALVSLIMLVPWLLSRVIVSKARGASEDTVATVSAEVRHAAPYSATHGALRSPLESSSEGLQCVSLGVMGRRVWARLSDGRILTEASPELEAIERSRLRVSGQWIPVIEAQIKSPPAAGPVGL